MPRIFDNIDQSLLPALRETLSTSNRADFCVGFFNLRGWKQIDDCVERWPGGNDHSCRLLIGMHRPPEEDLRQALLLSGDGTELDNQTALRLKRRIAQGFREQLTMGFPTNEDEAALRRLARQIKAHKVVVKLFLRHSLHAKLYLLFRADPIAPIVGYLGSSNLTFAGLSHQGELNVDVVEADAALKLAEWFEDRWSDRWCVDISMELVDAIEESWAREDSIPPYHIYVKMAYHLSQEAREGLAQFAIPPEFGKLFEFQRAAVRIAAHHLNKRNGVLIGDVVGLGKTLMASAVARIFEDDFGLETLIISPKNLVGMWEDYRDQYRLHAKVLSLSRVINELPNLRRYRVTVIDESHNLRNREGKKYAAIRDYIQKNGCKVVLLTATPYNKTYVDLSNQLRLFIPEDRDIGIRPEKVLAELGETEFVRRHQCGLRTLAAFEKSEHTDDWRELMRLYMVRRTRSFILANYAETDERSGRKYLTFENGTKFYFPIRSPKTLRFTVNDEDPQDQYARLYSDGVVDAVNSLKLPRYGLANYIAPQPKEPPTPEELRALADLSRAGKRLMGFCRTNLFKRLESSGQVFLQSLERHALRNYVFLHAIDNNLPLPIGTQDTGLLDVRIYDEDEDAEIRGADLFEESRDDEALEEPARSHPLRTDGDFRDTAKAAYEFYRARALRRFKWIRPDLFKAVLRDDLLSDARSLISVLLAVGEWDPARDTKLIALHRLLTHSHRQDKVIVFTQFADTVRYLDEQLKAQGMESMEGVTGETPDPTVLAWRFSPVSNEKQALIQQKPELRVLIATDVLSEGQNLQDAFVVVNFDLPWAIIRLVQRAGRVDRIGQAAETILCYSFLPAEGVERILRLRARVCQRLRENEEVVGTDEAFFEDVANHAAVLDLYNEKAGILDGEEDTEVDLASYAYQIWKNAITQDPELQKEIPGLPPVVFSAKEHSAQEKKPQGVLVYAKTGDGNDALAWVDTDGNTISQSQLAILKAAECTPEVPAIPRDQRHHELVRIAISGIGKDDKSIGGALGRPSGARFRTYERLKRYAEQYAGTLFDTPELRAAIDDVYRAPLRPSAIDTLNRQLRSSVSDDALVQLVVTLREEDRLCVKLDDAQEAPEPQIICSLGLTSPVEPGETSGAQA